MKLEAAQRLLASAEEFTFDPHGHWKFGSGVVPGTQSEHSIKSPLKLDEHAFAVMKPNAYNAKPEKGVFRVPVAELYTWQDHVDPGKLRPLPEHLSKTTLEPLELRQVDGKLVLWQGNHRAASAFVQGVKELYATVINFDDKKNIKYRKDAKTASEGELSKHLRAV